MGQVTKQTRGVRQRLHFGPDAARPVVQAAGASAPVRGRGKTAGTGGFDWDHDFEALLKERAPLAVVYDDDPPLPAGHEPVKVQSLGVWGWGAILGGLVAIAIPLGLPEWLGIGAKSPAPVPWSVAETMAPVWHAVPEPQTLYVYTDADAARATQHMRRASTGDLSLLAAVMQAEAARPGHPLAAHFRDTAHLARTELARRGMGAGLAH